jgi:hypothetical protein
MADQDKNVPTGQESGPSTAKPAPPPIIKVKANVNNPGDLQFSEDRIRYQKPPAKSSDQDNK